MAQSHAVDRSSPDDDHDAELFAALADELADGVQGLYLLARSVAQGLDAGLPCAVAALTGGAPPDALYHEAERRAVRIPPADHALVIEQALERCPAAESSSLSTITIAITRAT